MPSVAAAEAVAGTWSTLCPPLSEGVLATVTERYNFLTMTPVQANHIYITEEPDECVHDVGSSNPSAPHEQRCMRRGPPCCVVMI